MDYNKTGDFYSGTSGIVLPVPNKLSFPVEFRDKSRLTYYASLFNSLEVNSSFYKVPMASTVANWASSVPLNFQFTFKLWRGITHIPGLNFNADDVNHFMNIIAHTGYRRGCLLVQFPPGLKINSLVQLQKLLILMRAADPDNLWKVALEFRNRSWYHEQVYELLNEYRVGMVFHDMPSSAISSSDDISVKFVYLRFHGQFGDYKGGYTDDFLYEYAQYIQGWRAEGKTVYVYFNNTIGDAISNLTTLNSFVSKVSISL